MRKQSKAFTLIELIVVIAVVALLSAFSLSAVTGSRSKAQRIACVNNLKQVGLAFRTWAIAHDGFTPMTVARAAGGDSEDVGYKPSPPSKQQVAASRKCSSACPTS